MSTELQVSEVSVADIRAAIELVEQRLSSEAWRKIEILDRELAELPRQEMPLNHLFPKGLYVRTIFIPAGTLATTRIHMTEHPFILSMGVISVWDDEAGAKTFHAFHQCITKPGTRRVLYAHTDTLITTVHLNPLNKTNPNEIVREITYGGGKFAELGAAEDERFAKREELCTT